MHFKLQLPSNYREIQIKKKSTNGCTSNLWNANRNNRWRDGDKRVKDKERKKEKIQHLWRTPSTAKNPNNISYSSSGIIQPGRYGADQYSVGRGHISDFDPQEMAACWSDRWLVKYFRSREELKLMGQSSVSCIRAINLSNLRRLQHKPTKWKQL